MKSKTKESKQPVDLGVDHTCNVCNKQLCTCEDRLPDGNWKMPERSEEKEKVIQISTCVNSSGRTLIFGLTNRGNIQEFHKYPPNKGEWRES